MAMSADSPPWDRIDPRQILVIDCLQGESVSGSVGRPKIELLPDFSPSELLSTDSIVTASRCNDIEELVQVDIFAVNSGLKVKRSPGNNECAPMRVGWGVTALPSFSMESC